MFQKRVASSLQSTSKYTLPVRAELLLALLIAALIAIFVTWQVGENRISEALEEQSQLTELSIEVQQLEISLLQMRRREKDFILRRDLRYVDYYKKELEASHTNLDNLKKLPAAYLVSSQLDTLRDHVDTHLEIFSSVSKWHELMGLRDNRGKVGALRRAADRVEKKLTELNADSLLIMMLMMRKHEKGYMLRRTPEYVSEMRARAQKFEKLLDNSSLDEQTKKQISILMDIYQHQFSGYVQTATKMEHETLKLSQTYSDMTRDILAIERLVKHQHEAGNVRVAEVRAHSALVFSITGILVFLAAACLLFTITQKRRRLAV